MSVNQCVSCSSKDKIIEELKNLLESKNNEIESLKLRLQQYEAQEVTVLGNVNEDLNSSEISRYGRQLIMPQVGMSGQKKLKKTSVLIVGAGGLGCPVGLYLTAAGVGTVGIVDYDTVEICNLQRQILYNEKGVGALKSESFVQSLRSLNSSTNLLPYTVLLNSKNATDIVKNFDIIVDATDNAPTRYLLNDVSCFLNKPLVSGSALRFEGQLTVYNHEGSPCYRCLYPVPPSTSVTTNCSDGGIIGAVTGVIGCLQALEVIKVAIGLPASYANKLLHFDGEVGTFKVFNLRGKNPGCAVCGLSPKITELIDYEFFCNSFAKDKVENVSILHDSERISCKQYKEVLDNDVPHILLDVRPHLETQICSLPNSINIPFNKLTNGFKLDCLYEAIKKHKCDKVNYVICRRGNDSQKAVQFLSSKMQNIAWCDIKGGFLAWHNEVDANFPIY